MSEPITHQDIVDLIDAVKHPVIQVRPLGESALKAVAAHRDIRRSLRTVFLGTPDRSTAIK